MSANGFNSEKSETQRPRILLTNTTWWPTAARLATRLQSAGFQVSAIYPATGHPLSKTSALAQQFRYHPVRPVEGLLAAIRQVDPDVVIPCDDRATEHLHDVFAAAKAQQLESVQSLIERSLGSPRSFEIVSDRYRLLELASRAGIRTPATSLLSEASDLEKIRRFPFVLKSSGSWGGHGVRTVRNASEAASAFARMARPLNVLQVLNRWVVNRDPFWILPWWKQAIPRIVGQEFVPGKAANFSGLSWNGKLLAGVAVEAVETQGSTGPATVVRVIEHEEMRFAAERLAAALGLSGFFGLDFVLEEESRAAYLIEMNPRCTPPCHLCFEPERDPVTALYKAVAGTLPSAPAEPVGNTLVAYFPQAYHWNPRNPLISRAFHDVPWAEKDLTAELLRIAYPDRGLLARISNRLRGLTLEDRARKANDLGVQDPRPSETSLGALSRSVGSNIT